MNDTITSPSQTIAYAEPTLVRRTILPTPTAITLIICGTILLLAPWWYLTLMQGNGLSGSAVMVHLAGWPIGWFTEAAGAGMILFAIVRGMR